MSKKVAIYARYSSDMQSEASIEDQVRLAELHCKRQGLTVIKTYSDAAVSGASMMRSGIQQLMQDATQGKFDLVVAEALDRLSRDQADIAAIYKRLQFAGVGIFTLSEGEINTMHIGLKGTMNQLFLKDLADKTRRGLRGRIEKGKSGGGLCYGYTVVKQYDANGEAIRGDRVIHPEQAAIVQRIFKDYAEGKSPKAIAHQLNKEGVTAPSGKSWGQSTINGNRERGNGILNNELYIGLLTWNRQRYIKNPDTGTRVSRMNPESEWIRKDVPELRILDQELWDKVKERQGELVKRTQERGLWSANRPKSLFSHLLKCGCCGSGFSKVSQHHFGCSAARNKGTCDNKLTIRQDVIERTVTNALYTHLMDPELCEIFCQEYMATVKELGREQNAKRYALEAERQKLEAQMENYLKAIGEGLFSTSLKEKIETNEAKQQAIKEQLEKTDEVKVILHPSMATHYRNEVNQLIQSLSDPEKRPQASELLRSLIDKIVLTPKKPPQSGLSISLMGDLAGILSVALDSKVPMEERETVVTTLNQMSLNPDVSGYNPYVQEALAASPRNHSDLLTSACLIARAFFSFEPWLS